jgi:hypothetical protein
LDGSTDSSLDSSFIAGTNGIGERLSEYRFTEEKRREEKVDDMRGAMPVIETDRHGRRLRSLLLE